MPANPPLIDSLPFWVTAEANVTMDDNSRVSDWADPLPGLRHAAQAAGLLQPLFVSNALGTFPVVRWAGGQSLYLLGGPLGDTNFTIFVAGRANADRVAGGSPVNGQRLLFYQYGAPDSAGASLSVGANGIGLYEFGPTISPHMEAAVDASVLCPLAVRYENQTPAIFLNGTQVGAFVNPSTMFTQPTVQIPNTIGGIGDSLADGFVGDIAEILIYNRALSEAERQQVEAYLQAKYGCLASSSSSLVPEQSSESLVPSESPSSDSGESLSSIPSVPDESSASLVREDVPDPAPVSEGLGVWLRSDRHVTLDGGRVQSWADARGLPVAGSQPDPGRQPGWIENVFGSFLGGKFGISESLQFPDFGWPPGEFTLFILARPGADRILNGALTAGGQRVLWSGSSSGPSVALSAGTNGVALYEPAISNTPLAETTAPITSLCPLTLRYGGGVRTLFLNGSAVWSQPDSNAQQVNVGRNLGGIEADNTGSSFDGVIAEVLIYNRALSEQERVLVETYLQARYGCLTASSSNPGESSGSAESSSSKSSESPSSASSDPSSSETPNDPSGSATGSLAIYRDGQKLIDTGTMSVYAGEVLDLEVRGIDAQGNSVAVSDVTWSISGIRLKDYDPTKATDQKTKLSDDDRKKTTIGFHWISGGIQTVGVAATAAGQGLIESVQINVMRPEVKIKATSDKKDKQFRGRVFPTGPKFVALELRADGIVTQTVRAEAQIHFEVPDTGDVPGEHAWLQILNFAYKTSTLTDGTSGMPQNIANGLDIAFPYPSGDDTMAVDNASIATSRPPQRSFTYNGAVTMYYMYRAFDSVPKRRWVPLKKVEWVFSEEGTCIDPNPPANRTHWSGQATMSTNPVDSDALVAPTWGVVVPPQ